MFAFQSKEKMGSSSEGLSSEASAKSRPFVGGVSNSELIQLLSGSASDAPESPNVSSSQNTSGIPDELKAKYEQRSGVSMDDVSVHYNSDKPVQYGALAYTQGNDVYLGPGQEKHLGHELGHVIQQKQGRVPVTGSVGGAPLNDDSALEQEADSFLSSNSPVQHITAGYHPDSGAPIQRLRINLSGDGNDGDPVVRTLQYYNIPTGGERLHIPNSDPDEVINTVTAYEGEIGPTEDIVFEGHGWNDENATDSDEIVALQRFSPDELAQMAADIKKPDDWKGRIILLGCSAGQLADLVAEEYYDLTGNSVTVIGANQNIFVTEHPLLPQKTRFDIWDDKEKKEFLSSEFYTQYFDQLWFHALLPYANALKFFFCTLPTLNPSPGNQSIQTDPLFNGFLEQFNELINTTQQILDTYPAEFWNWVPVKDNLNSLCSALSSIIKFDSSFTLEKATNSTAQAMDFFDDIWTKILPMWDLLFKAPLDFNDKTIMTYATYPPPKDATAPPATKQSSQPTDDPKFQQEAIKAYYPIINQSCIGDWMKKNISLEPNRAGSTNPPSYVLDSKKRDEKLRETPNFEFFELLSFFFSSMVEPLLYQIYYHINDPSKDPKSKIMSALNLTRSYLSKLNTNLKTIKENLPENFREEYPDLQTNLNSLSVALNQLHRRLSLYALYNNFSSKDLPAMQQRTTLTRLLNLARAPLQKIKQTFFEEVRPLFTVPDLSDKKTTISATDSPLKDATDPPAPKRSPQNDSTPPATKQSSQPTDTPKNLPDSLSSSKLFGAPKSPDPSE